MSSEMVLVSERFAAVSFEMALAVYAPLGMRRMLMQRRACGDDVVRDGGREAGGGVARDDIGNVSVCVIMMLKRWTPQHTYCEDVFGDGVGVATTFETTSGSSPWATTVIWKRRMPRCPNGSDVTRSTNTSPQHRGGLKPM